MAADLTADVVIVGAGPAGAATALMLAPFHRTLLVDRLAMDDSAPPGCSANGFRIGESMPAAARRLLRDMGLWQDFQRQGHAPCFGARSLWGGPEPLTADSIRDPDGPGWHLDRTRFDAWLRRSASRRGAALVTPAQASGLSPTSDGWRLSLTRHGRALAVTTRFIVDAGGRTAPVVRAFGQRHQAGDRLVCRWCYGTASGDAGTTVTIADPEGWWYTAPLPAGRRILAFHTDADLPAAKAPLRTANLLDRARAQPDLATLLLSVDFQPLGEPGYCTAHSRWAAPSAGPGWLAVGDAALACDPLSSQGLFNALYSGLMAAHTIRRALAGDTSATEDYQNTIARVADAYRAHLTAWYALEARWPEQPFWARRRDASHDLRQERPFG